MLCFVSVIERAHTFVHERVRFSIRGRSIIRSAAADIFVAVKLLHCCWIYQLYWSLSYKRNCCAIRAFTNKSLYRIAVRIGFTRQLDILNTLIISLCSFCHKIDFPAQKFLSNRSCLIATALFAYWCHHCIATKMVIVLHCSFSLL